MKKNLLFLALSASALSVVSCTPMEPVEPNEPKLATLTFEDQDWKGGENYTGAASWSSLIDDKEYDGKLLYNSTYYADKEMSISDSEYVWSDENNTFLTTPELLDSAWGYGVSYSNGGIAVSNFTTAIAETTGFMNQLSVAQGGNNDSDNFAVAFLPASLYFGDSKARVIDHLYISATSYLASVCKYGNDYSAPLAADNYFKVTAEGLNAEGEVIATSDFYLAKDGKLNEDWARWDLFSLGAISSINFTIDSDVATEYGISLPTYFAIDDVAVVVE